MIPAALAILLWVSGAGPADPKGTLARLLSVPLSPGAVALLGPYVTDPAVMTRLEGALGDPRSETRSAAARLIATVTMRELRKAVEDALAAETDAEAAREEIRALVAIGTPDDETLFAVSDRFDRRLDPDLAKILARARGSKALPALLWGRDWNLTAREWAISVWIASRGSEETFAPALARSMGTGNAKRWSALLDLAQLEERAIGRQVVATGLRSPVPEIAKRSALYLIWVRMREPLDIDFETFGTLTPPDGASAELIFLFGLLDRSFKGLAASDAAWIASLETAQTSFADDVGPGNPLLRAMTMEEREAVRARHNRLQNISPGDAERMRGKWYAASTKRPERSERPFMLRTISGLPRGVVRDAIDVGKCRPPRDGMFGITAVWYAWDGRPKELKPYESAASDACEAVALGLSVMTLARDDEFPISGAPHFLFGAARSDCLSALEEADVCPSVCPEDREDTFRVGGSVRAPSIVERNEPRYPRKSRLDGKEGAVVLEAIIGEDGCVTEVTVIDSVDPLLDAEAARAVAQWKYRPARIGDRAVRVYLTVTVTFRL